MTGNLWHLFARPRPRSRHRHYRAALPRASRGCALPIPVRWPRQAPRTPQTEANQLLPVRPEPQAPTYSTRTRMPLMIAKMMLQMNPLTPSPAEAWRCWRRARRRWMRRTRRTSIRPVSGVFGRPPGTSSRRNASPRWITKTGSRGRWKSETLPRTREAATTSSPRSPFRVSTSRSRARSSRSHTCER